MAICVFIYSGIKPNVMCLRCAELFFPLLFFLSHFLNVSISLIAGR